ncbi:hypothetical protein PENCOP_c012G06790 [Penicillium coprophilum]|uniref:Uncharacterized protein n=1 Tax=Penicillium coprophilum TaxID=36646 RepID=A0A1V6UDF0_9EURO|nr:hypothetical protein PENCOP_c012G06790 [Penicillium coprophilum]
MDDLPSGSRLADVRPQVAIDSESDESGSTTPTSADTANTDTEPFPEYDESECEMLASSIAAEKPLEEAWINALGKAGQHEIRLLHVNPNIIPYFESDPSQRSQVVLKQLQDLLSEPQLRPEIREQFITIINATLKLNLVLFHQSPEFLVSKEIKDARRPLDTILKHVEFVENMLKEQLQTAEQVSYALEEVSLEVAFAYERLRKMATVVAKNMKKPRFLERRLLALYMDMYEEWIHTPFLHMRRPQILDEQVPNFPRTKLARHVLIIWAAINRCIETYVTLGWVTLEIKQKYFAPTMGYLCDSPEIWEQCWERYQEIKKDQNNPTEQDFSGCVTN